MTWTVDDLLALTSDYVGEAPGDFYNITTRLNYFNMAQRELVQETRALVAETTLSTTDETRTVSLPSDFLTFTQTAPVYEEDDDFTTLRVISAADADRLYPEWKDSDLYDDSTPESVWVTNSETLNILPLPGGGDIHLWYVQEPNDLTDFDDVPFNGNSNLNQYAPALAFKAASIITMPQSAQYSAQLQRMYIEEQKKMRHHTRRSPQKGQFIKPNTRPSTKSLMTRIHDWRQKG